MVGFCDLCKENEEDLFELKLCLCKKCMSKQIRAQFEYLMKNMKKD